MSESPETTQSGQPKYEDGEEFLLGDAKKLVIVSEANVSDMLLILSLR